jgi:hypothetical protein
VSAAVPQLVVAVVIVVSVESARVDRFPTKSCRWLLPGRPGKTIGSSLAEWVSGQRINQPGEAADAGSCPATPVTRIGAASTAPARAPRRRRREGVAARVIGATGMGGS